MDSLTFIVEMTKALAWPLAVAGIALAYRKRILALLARVNELKFGDFGAKFAEEASAVAVNVAEAGAGRIPTNTGVSNDRIRLAEMAPRAAVVQWWFEIENLLQKLANKHGLDSTPHYAYARELRNRNIIDTKDFAALEGLRSLRNLAVHAQNEDLTPHKALEFGALAMAVQFILEAKLK